MTPDVAGSLSLADVMQRLATDRPVFHSEADFQHHLAWQIHTMAPELRIRLEVRPDARVREQVDVMVDVPGGTGTVVELKYLKASWRGAVGSEHFELPNTGAHDIVRYDVVKDVGRVERCVAARPGWTGHTVVLTNDSLHWRPPSHDRATIADAFRIHEGMVLRGDLEWGSAAGVGTTRGREAVLALAHTYEAKWHDYSNVGGKNGVFRHLILSVAHQAGGGELAEPSEID